LGDVISSYRRAAEAAGAELLPAGLAWREAWRRRPKLALYGPDGFHPSRLGTYVAAVVVYSELVKVSPIGLPRAISLPHGRYVLKAATARTVQAAAAEALRE
jgi:hypothetical protein